MEIISQDKFKEICKELYTSLGSKLFEYMLPSTKVGSTYDFLAFMEVISRESENYIRKIIVELIEMMDYKFRYSNDRITNYYVKQNRSRTIITMYGEITYKRTEYTDRLTGKPYIYVDSKLHIGSRERYAPDVRAKVYSNYADSKSMTEVGRNIGDIIEAKYHNGSPLTFAIPRQTIQRILKSTKEVRILSDVKKEVDCLNILFDEKWIPGQFNPNQENENKALMTKAAMIFEKQDKSNIKRNKLVNCTYYSSYNRNTFAFDLLELLDSKYDLTKIKTINIMGDGANWIKEASNVFKLPGISFNTGLDKFHTGQALDRITKDKEIYKKMFDYLIHKDIKNFDLLINELCISSPSKEEKIRENAEYLKRHINEIITMNTKIKVPCAMEQVISHHLASQFTCVAKAYSPKNINYYTANRDAYRNNYNMKLIFAKANDLKDKQDDLIKINKRELDLSFFDNQSPLPYYSLKVKEGSKRFKMF